MDFVSFLTKLCAIMALITGILYSYQAFYLFLPLIFRRKKHQPVKRLRYAVLIAARNEEAVIPHLLDSINAQDYPAELIDTYVVADNCTDQTAAVAEAHGATVFTRFNHRQVGKGYALDYLIEHIRELGKLDDYDAFLIFDADNLLCPDYIRQINQLPSDGFQAFCGYRNTKNFGTNWITSGYALWYLHESSHANRSRYTIGSGAAVNGTGFGFTRALLERLGGWHFFTLTEDIEFNNWCATNGIKIGYCHDAMLYDEQPVTWSASWKQRTRWAQGGFQVSFKYIGRLLRGLFRGRWITYTCIELMSLDFWGFSFATLTGTLSALAVLLQNPLLVALEIFLVAFCTAYLSMVYMGLLTIVMEWKRIVATPQKKIASIFTFPFFMMTFAPITMCAMFRKFEWTPIAHTVAIGSAELNANRR